MTDHATAAPDLASYDCIAISSSAGKDSLAAAVLTCDLARAADILDRVVVIHADLGRAEWQGTADLARRQAECLDVRFIMCERTLGDLYDHVFARRMWPGQTQSLRYCTADHKTSQIHKVYTRLVRELRAPVKGQPVRVLEVLGLRAAESPGRAKLLPFRHNGRASNGRRHVDTWLPVHGWTHAQAEPYKALSGHPAYAAGMPRASCVFCVYAQKGALMLAGMANPALLDTACELEAAINHRFTDSLSLAEVRQAIQSGEPVVQSQVDFDCGL